MSEETFGSAEAIVNSLVGHPERVAALTARIETRSIDLETIERLVAYARQRLVTSGHAIVRKMLTDAGVSWEAL